MSLHSDIISICNTYLHGDTIIRYDHLCDGSVSHVFRLYGTHQTYILKTPIEYSYIISSIGELMGEYTQAHHFYLFYNHRDITSYGVFEHEGKIYHLMSYVTGHTPSFDHYQEYHIVQLAHHLATLHNTPIDSHYADNHYTSFSWRKYLFGPKSLYEIYDAQRYIANSHTIYNIMQAQHKSYMTLSANTLRPCTLIHGDIHYDNIILMDNDRIGFIDPHPICYGDPVIDIGAILFGIEISYISVERKDYTTLQELFLNTYLAQRDDPGIFTHLPIVIQYHLGKTSDISTIQKSNASSSMIQTHIQELIAHYIRA